MGTQEHWTAAQYQEYLRQRAKGGNKYHAVKAQADGRTYDSRSECKRAKELAKDLPKLKRKYTYASSGLFIRPAEGPEDLLKEGCAQHNCVYSCYTEPYLDRKTDILFVRKQSNPDQSYVTVEFKNGAVIQCRADHNRPAPPDVQEFMQAWLAHLKSNRKAKAVS